VRPFILLACLVACGGAPANPAAIANRPVSGVSAAGYEVRDVAAREAFVSVWSHGAYPGTGERGAVVHVGLEVENVGETAFSFEPALLSLEPYDDRGFPLPAPQHVSMEPMSDVTVPPGTIRRYHFYFVVRAERPAMEIGSLRVRWALLHSDGRRYQQLTDFAAEAERAGEVRRYVPVYGFYDPFLAPLHTRARTHHFAVRRIAAPRRPPYPEGPHSQTGSPVAPVEEIVP